MDSDDDEAEAPVPAAPPAPLPNAITQSGDDGNAGVDPEDGSAAEVVVEADADKSPKAPKGTKRKPANAGSSPSAKASKRGSKVCAVG